MTWGVKLNVRLLGCLLKTHTAPTSVKLLKLLFGAVATIVLPFSVKYKLEPNENILGNSVLFKLIVWKF